VKCTTSRGVAVAACAALASCALPGLAGATRSANARTGATPSANVGAPAASNSGTAPTATGASDTAPPAPIKFRLTLRLSGRYASKLTAPDRTVARSISFASAPAISYDIFLYPSGTPPAYVQTATGVQRSLTAGMRGRWSVEASGTQACQAGGTLVDSTTGTSPLLATGQYRRHGYAVVLEAAPDADPFTFQGTHTGSDSCATPNPWDDWVVSFGHVRNHGAATFHVPLTLTQRQLRIAARGHRVSVPVHLPASAGLRSSDCGSSVPLAVTCHQSLGWTGHVTVSRSRT
jgi:hypothetical protein